MRDQYRSSEACRNTGKTVVSAATVKCSAAAALQSGTELTEITDPILADHPELRELVTLWPTLESGCRTAILKVAGVELI